jgi:hypothetical protein
MLPKLEAQDPERLLAVPFDYAEEVGIAIAGRQTGKLSLLGIEADGFPWEIPALRLVGASQFKLKLFDDARLTWEKIRAVIPQTLRPIRCLLQFTSGWLKAIWPPSLTWVLNFFKNQMKPSGGCSPITTALKNMKGRKYML